MTSTPTRPVDNVVIATKGLQDRNINTQAGTTVENKGKLILIDHCSLRVSCSPLDPAVSNSAQVDQHFADLEILSTSPPERDLSGGSLNL